MARSESVSRYSIRSKNNTYLYTKGMELSLDGKNYIGEYHIKGDQIFTGPIHNRDSKELQEIYPNPDEYIYDKIFKFDPIVKRFVDPVPYLYKPLQQAYSVGFDMRYFVEKLDDDQSFAIEIDKVQYDNLGIRYGIDSGLYISAAVKWKLTGRLEEIINHNRDELNKYTPFLPSITYAVRNFTEFAQITLV
jgi:hypothetical protein